MTNILYTARWAPNSKAVEAYTRPELVDMHPQQIHDQLVRYHRMWSLKKLSYLALVTVESKVTRFIHLRGPLRQTSHR